MEIKLIINQLKVDVGNINVPGKSENCFKLFLRWHQYNKVLVGLGAIFARKLKERLPSSIRYYVIFHLNWSPFSIVHVY